jgi:hypothetical protein
MRIRYALSLPLAGLQRIIVAFGWVMLAIQRVAVWINRGTKFHVFWPVVLAKRWVRGVPTWQPVDLIRGGMQPLTKAQRAVAAASDELVKIDCTCGRASCWARHGAFAPKPRFGSLVLPTKDEVLAFIREAEQNALEDQVKARERVRACLWGMDLEKAANLSAPETNELLDKIIAAATGKDPQ